jgi:hypothetical protein
VLDQLAVALFPPEVAAEAAFCVPAQFFFAVCHARRLKKLISSNPLSEYGDSDRLAREI